VGLTLVTAVFGGFDNPKPLPPDHGFDDAVLVTDNPDAAPAGWRVIVDDFSEHPRLAAKRAKLAPWFYVDVQSSVWVDGSCQILDGQFHTWITEQTPADLTAWQHPEQRDCLFQEASYCQDWEKYSDQPIREQTSRYRAAGMPEHHGLYACGTLRWEHTPAAIDFGDEWLREQTTGSIQDQISLPFLLWSLPLNFATFNQHQYANPFLRWHAHN